MICHKVLLCAPPQPHAMLLGIQGYDKSIPGEAIDLADTLSRLPDASDCSDVPIEIRVNTLSFNQAKVTDIRKTTQNDATLSPLKDLIFHGWPKSKKDVPTDLCSFWSCRDFKHGQWNRAKRAFKRSDFSYHRFFTRIFLPTYIWILIILVLQRLSERKMCTGQKLTLILNKYVNVVQYARNTSHSNIQKRCCQAIYHHYRGTLL